MKVTNLPNVVLQQIVGKLPTKTNKSHAQLAHKAFRYKNDHASNSTRINELIKQIRKIYGHRTVLRYEKKGFLIHGKTFPHTVINENHISHGMNANHVGTFPMDYEYSNNIGFDSSDPRKYIKGGFPKPPSDFNVCNIELGKRSRYVAYTVPYRNKYGFSLTIEDIDGDLHLMEVHVDKDRIQFGIRICDRIFLLVMIPKSDLKNGEFTVISSTVTFNCPFDKQDLINFMNAVNLNDIHKKLIHLLDQYKEPEKNANVNFHIATVPKVRRMLRL
jgi:hypothetical protein